MEQLSETPKQDAMPFLSDHTYQSAAFAFYSADHRLLFSISGATWNLQDRGFSKRQEITNSFSNNPWDIDESLENYTLRKQAQIDKIFQKIITGKDFLFLQEIDFLTPNDKTNYKTPQKIKTQLKNIFQKKLHTHSWRLLLSPHHEEESTLGDREQSPCHPLAIIYNTKTLFFQSKSRGLFLHPRSGFRAYEWSFLHIPSHEAIALTNLHLAYEVDYGETLYQYQKNQIQQDLCTVIGGDTNHSASVFASSCGNALFATNLEQRENYHAISHLDKRTGTVKNYDSFFVNPGQRSYVKFNQLPGEYFNLV